MLLLVINSIVYQSFLLNFINFCLFVQRMRSPGINGEGELRGQPAIPGSPGKMAVKTECMCVCVCVCVCVYLFKGYTIHKGQLMLTNPRDDLEVSQGQRTWYHSIC